MSTTCNTDAKAVFLFSTVVV